MVEVVFFCRETSNNTPFSAVCCQHPRRCPRPSAPHTAEISSRCRSSHTEGYRQCPWTPLMLPHVVRDRYNREEPTTCWKRIPMLSFVVNVRRLDACFGDQQAALKSVSLKASLVAHAGLFERENVRMQVREAADSPLTASNHGRFAVLFGLLHNFIFNDYCFSRHYVH